MTLEEELVKLLEGIISFDRWGFHRSYTKTVGNGFPEVIYDSEWCRARFTFEHSGEKYPIPDIRLKVRYGRLHAPDNDFFMIVDNEKYWCWHDDNFILFFLDNMSPKEVADQWNVYKRRAQLKSQLIESMIAQKISHPEREIRVQSAVWDYYGQKLFEVFDLRQPALWKRYVQFTKEFHKLISSETHFGYPSQDKIY